MLSRFFVLGLTTLAVMGAACSSASVDEDESSANAASEGSICKQAAAQPNGPLADLVRAEKGELTSNGAPVISNFTAWPTYAPGGDAAYDPRIVAARTDAGDARTNIASRFGDSCAPSMKSHLEKQKPNVYIYFTGFGGASQNNSLLDEGAVLRWINTRDPKGLIFSVNWNCAGSHDSFCKDNAAKLKSGDASPENRHMTDTINAVAPTALATVKQILAQTDANQAGYNTALSHAMQLGALLVDQLLVADEGKDKLGGIHFLGYSMGAHAASQLLVQDFVGNGGGFKWTQPGQCDNGADTCTVAHLKKVKWALSLGLSGWSEALLSYNQFDASGIPRRAAADTQQFRNGGLFRISDPRWNGKGNVFNRRMDPTSNSDDTFQRGFGDIFFGDYNHYSHDYSMPLFVNTGFVRALDAFLEAPKVTDIKGFGVIHDNAGLVEFDDCPATGTCEASSSYLAHAVNRSHADLQLARTPAIKTTDGVPHAEKASNRAVTFTQSGSAPIVLNTFDQEDLRGGVELYYRPQYDVTSSGTRGLFSYGDCAGSAEELMPQAVVENGNVIFTMSYQGQPFTATVSAAAAKLARGQWTHLAFNWELPVVSMSSVRSPTLKDDVAKHGQAIVLAAGLRKALPTTYNRQEGAGKLSIFANGKLVGEAALGTAASKRECLAAAQVISTRAYTVNGRTMPAFIPYARYDAVTGDPVSIGGPPIGTKCKAYRVRNTQAFFGCGKSKAVNAEGDMDDIALVWGPGRNAYENVDAQTGAPKTWPIGVAYDATPFKAR